MHIVQNKANKAIFFILKINEKICPVSLRHILHLRQAHIDLPYELHSTRCPKIQYPLVHDIISSYGNGKGAIRDNFLRYSIIRCKRGVCQVTNTGFRCREDANKFKNMLTILEVKITSLSLLFNFAPQTDHFG